jgi:diacylglycerol kinase family enzyme
MSVRQRLIAARRLPTGSHLPHPDLSQQRSTSGEWTFARPLTLWLDGVRVGRTKVLRVRVVPDALTVCI